MIRGFAVSLIGLAVAALGGMAAAPAWAIPYGTYQLGSHPDGAKDPPPYGLRLDDLDGPGIWTFDFSDPASDMKMTVQTNKIAIFGTTVGGVDVCTMAPCAPKYKAGTADLWDIMFVYDMGTIQEIVDGGVNDTEVRAHHQNFGTIERQSDNMVWDLRDHSKTKTSAGLSFQLGDEGGGGHRGFPGISGWGWTDHTPQGVAYSGNDPSDDGCCSDWLYTATRIPEPGSGALFLIGLAAVGFASRRFRKAM